MPHGVPLIFSRIRNAANMVDVNKVATAWAQQQTATLATDCSIWAGQYDCDKNLPRVAGWLASSRGGKVIISDQVRDDTHGLD